jgi:TonB family protein
MNAPRRLIASLAAALPFAVAAPAQAPAPVPLSRNLAALMSLAWQQNGLHGSDLKPWHVRASWQMLDDKGKAERQGTWEEWWAGPHESKMVYDSPDYQQTYWSTAQGNYTLESHGSPGWIEDLIEQMIFRPAATQKDLTHLQLKEADFRDHGVTLHCVTNKVSLEAFCFEPGMAVLRTKVTSVLQITFNSIVKFQGRYLAKDVYVARVGMPAVKIRVDAIEPLAPEAGNEFAPSPQAKFVSSRLSVPGGVIAGRRLSGDAPGYPLLARQENIQGTVVLWGVIGKDGVIRNLEVIGGPTMLQGSAINAVKTWRYQPYLLNGKPVEVHTQIDVVYHLGPYHLGR